jgi:uncharacterized integral membrane protein
VKKSLSVFDLNPDSFYINSMKEDSVKTWVLVGALALLLSFSYLFMLSNEDNVSLILLFAALFLVLVLASVVIKSSKKKRR